MHRMNAGRKRKLLIWGAGGFGREVLDIAHVSLRSAYDEIAFLDDGKPAGSSVNGARVAGDRTLLGTQPDATDVCVAVGNPVVRERLVKVAERHGHRVRGVTDPTAIVRPSARTSESAIL